MANDWIKAKCEEVAANAVQPNNALYSRTSSELAATLFFIAGPRAGWPL